MRSLACALLISFALLALACAPPPASYSAETAAGAGASAPPGELEVSVRMESELAEDALVSESALPDAERSKGDSMQAAPPSADEETAASDPPPPPPPPPPRDADKKSKRKTLEGPSPQAATADSAGAKVDSTTIQEAIAKNVASFKLCLRSDMALRLEATISPSGDVIEARSPKSFPDDAKARDCVVLALKRLHFERFDGVVPARVSFELTLKRALDY